MPVTDEGISYEVVEEVGNILSSSLVWLLKSEAVVSSEASARIGRNRGNSILQHIRTFRHHAASHSLDHILLVNRVVMMVPRLLRAARA